MADYLDPVVIELEGRDQKLRDTLTRAKADIRRFAADVGRTRAVINIDAKLKDGALAEIRRRVAESPAAKLKVDLQLGAAQRDQLRAQLDGWDVRATVKPVMDRAAQRRVEVVLRELGRRIDVPIRPRIDTRSQRRAQSRLDRMTRNRTVTIRTRVVGDRTRLLGAGAGALGGAGQGGAAAGAAGGGGNGPLYGGLAVLGLTALPSIGALVPMLAGAATAAGTLKLGLSGVGKAADLAGKDTKKYHEALKKMSPAQRDFTKALVDVKGQFHDFGKDIQKAMLPGFTAALKDAAPVVKILGKGMTDMGRTFGDAARGLGRLMKDAGFQRDFTQVLKLGNQFVGELTRSMGPFIRSLLDFGAASGPTLKAFSDGIGGLLSKGLPGLFDGLKPGISGAASMLDGFFSTLNDKLLPALGRLSGTMGKTLGPLFGETFRVLGDLGAGAMDALAGGLKGLSPILDDLTYGLKAVRDLGKIIGPTMADTGKAIIDAFMPLGDSAKNAAGPLQQLDTWIKNNKMQILEWSRIFANVSIDIVSAAVGMAPKVIQAFRYMSTAILAGLSGMLHGATVAFGWVPGIGGKLHTASKEFDKFAGNWMAGLDTAQRKADTFAASTQAKLAAGKLKLDINNWQQQIEAAKAKLKTVPPSRQAALKATISDLEAKIRSAKGQLNSLNGKTATTYIKTVYQKVEAQNAPRFRAHGGPIHLAGGGIPDGGGRVSGPGTATSDSIPAMLSNGEYVVRAAAVAKYGERFLGAVNSGTLRLAGFAHGGLSQAAKDARGQLTGSFGISTFGREAGYRRTGFEHELAVPTDINALVSSLNGFRSEIKAAFSGHTESSLLKQLSKAGKSLINYDKQLTQVTSSLASAKTKLDDLKNSAAQLKASVSQSIMQGAGIVTQAPQAGFALSGADVVNNMQAELAKAQEFSNELQTLKKRGLSGDLLNQIASAGVDQGGATAAALAGASDAQIKQLNSMQSQLKKSADAAGSAVADSMYGAGIRAADGIVKGLERKQKSIEDAMLRIAKSMEKAIKKALGIRSPSTVMAQVGDFTALGFAKGIQRSSKHAVIAAQGMAMSVAQGATLASTPAWAGAPLSGARGGTTVVHHHHYESHVNVEGDVLSERKLGDIVEKRMLRLGMRNMSTYPPYKR